MQRKLLFITGLVVLCVFTAVLPLWGAPPQVGPAGIAQDIVLLYYTPGSAGSIDDLLPYVTYTDVSGKPRAWFFDGYILASDSKTVGSTDWAHLPFAPNQWLNALDAAVAKAEEVLGSPLSPRQVYLAMPYMTGSVESRQQLARQFIDETRKLWQQAQFKHLQLAGYWWYHEGIRDTAMRQAVEYAHSYLQAQAGVQPWEKTLPRLLLIPYDFGHPNRAQVKEFGSGTLPVDALWLQPNYLWADRGGGYDLQDLDEVARFALSQGASIEMEYDSGVPMTGWKTARYYHYLAGGVTHGYVQTPLTYYQSSWALKDAANSRFPAMRQLYEDTFAFSQASYTPRSIIIPGPATKLGSTEQLIQQFTEVGDAFLPKGLWPGKQQSAEQISSLRWVEPDPNQEYHLIFTLQASASAIEQFKADNTTVTNGVPVGKVTLRTLDGAESILGTYPLDGDVHTFWYTVPAALLQQKAPANPKTRLVYTIGFTTAVKIESSWVRSNQTVMTWNKDTAELWQAADGFTASAQEGQTLPGVYWQAVTNEIQWAGMDSTQPLNIGIEADTGEQAVYTLPLGSVKADGSGTFQLPSNLGEAQKAVKRVWVNPGQMPFHVSFGVEGDTAVAFKRPGVAIVPANTWSFVGQPVGMARRLAGTGSMQIDVPNTGESYTLRVTLTGIFKLDWTLKNGAGVVTSGSLARTDTEVVIPIPGGGSYELIWKGGATFKEAWLSAQN